MIANKSMLMRVRPVSRHGVSRGPMRRILNRQEPIYNSLSDGRQFGPTAQPEYRDTSTSFPRLTDMLSPERMRLKENFPPGTGSDSGQNQMQPEPRGLEYSTVPVSEHGRIGLARVRKCFKIPARDLP